MSGILFVIKDMGWYETSPGHWHADTPVGIYNCWIHEDRFYRHDKTDGTNQCDSIEDGKRQAQKHYEETMSEGLVQVECIACLQKIEDDAIYCNECYIKELERK